MKKKCLGCLRDVENAVGEGKATICSLCRVDYSLVPASCFKPIACQNCGGETNLIGALTFQKLPPPRQICLYFDCPNPGCGQKRMTIYQTGRALATVF